MSTTPQVNAWDYLTACGFSELQTVSIVMAALLRGLDVDLQQLRGYASDAGFTLPVSVSFDIGPDYRSRN